MVIAMLVMFWTGVACGFLLPRRNMSDSRQYRYGWVFALALVTFCIVAARCQDVHPKHPSQVDVEDTMAFKRVIIMSMDERLIYFKRELPMQVVLGSFAYDKYTRMDKGKLEGCYFAVYCKQHDFVYLLIPCKNKDP